MKQEFENLTDYIKSWETFSATPYYATDDEKSRGILTIGYGQTLPVADCPKVMTEEQAESDLISKLASWAMALPFSHLPVPLGVQNGAIAIIYNAGIGACPKLLKAAANLKLAEAYQEFFDCIYQSGEPLLGLIRRRACDSTIFKYGRYEKRDWITQEEKECFLKMNSANSKAIDIINYIEVQG